VREQLDEIVAFAGLEEFIDLPVRTYSSGMYMRLGFAIAAHIDADVLLLDEVFAVGDEQFQRKCFGKIFEFKQRGGTIVFVSHDASAVERLCDRAVLLRGGLVEFDVPRDREGSFEPQIVPKHQRRFHGFDDKIVAMYARGMTVRDIQAHLRELYGVEVGHDLISRVTDAVLDDVREWQARPLEDVYPILFLDALIVKVRDGGAVRNLACYVAIGVNLEGERDVLGLWFQRSEGAKFWLAVLTELKQRGVRDVLICCVDGLKGFPEAIEAVFPQAWVQTCIVHLIRQSLRFVPDKHRRTVAKDLRPIYTAVDADAAAEALAAFEQAWGERYPMIGKTWRESWEHVIPFLAFPPNVRRVVYTTNTIEALHRQIRKTIKTRGHFPTEEAARKLIYLSINNAKKSWKQTYHWSSALLSFKIHFGDRLP